MTGTPASQHRACFRNRQFLYPFQKARLGREWARESEHAHKGYPDWHPKEIETPGMQKLKPGRGIGFFPDIKGEGFRSGD